MAVQHAEDGAHVLKSDVHSSFVSQDAADACGFVLRVGVFQKFCFIYPHKPNQKHLPQRDFFEGQEALVY